MKLYRKSCKLGGSGGCVNLGTIYLLGKGGVKRDIYKALRLYKKACKLGNKTGCRNLKKLKALNKLN